MPARRILGPIYVIVSDELGSVLEGQDFEEIGHAGDWASRKVNVGNGEYRVAMIYQRTATCRSPRATNVEWAEEKILKLPKK